MKMNEFAKQGNHPSKISLPITINSFQSNPLLHMRARREETAKIESNADKGEVVFIGEMLRIYLPQLEQEQLEPQLPLKDMSV